MLSQQHTLEPDVVPILFQTDAATILESFIQAQKVSVRRALRRGFRKYLADPSDFFALLLVELQKMVTTCFIESQFSAGTNPLRTKSTFCKANASLLPSTPLYIILTIASPLPCGQFCHSSLWQKGGLENVLDYARSMQNIASEIYIIPNMA